MSDSILLTLLLHDDYRLMKYNYESTIDDFGSIKMFTVNYDERKQSEKVVLYKKNYPRNFALQCSYLYLY